MFASFEYEITREDEDIHYVEVVYQGHRYGTRWDREYDVEIISVMSGDGDFTTTADEDEAILKMALERVADDFADDDDAYGDYIYEMRGER